MIKRRFFLTSLVLLVLLIAGCKKEIVEEPYKPSNAYEAYVYSLTEVNLHDTALGKDWIASGEEALRHPVDVSLPVEEIFYVSPQETFAVAYRFEVLRGQRIELDVTVDSEKPSRLFIDCFRLQGEPQEEWIHVASANASEKRLVYEPRRDAAYIIRLQPELLRGGQYKVFLRKDASLDFPVSGRDMSSILSVYGASRDGGKRIHEGIDIYARRHTPVLAPCDARVRNVGVNDLGGNVVWLFDAKRSINLYFAHLQTQDVSEGMEVKAGQQIGTVGNTGNARTTPTHLHFGVYVRGSGPVDPTPYIDKIDDAPRSVRADLSLLGKWIRSSEADVSLRADANGDAQRILVLEKYAPMKVLAAVYRWYRVELADGISGFIYEGSVEPLAESLEDLQAVSNLEVKETPFSLSPTKEVLMEGETYSVLGSYEGYWIVRTQQGQTGWMNIPASVIDDR